MTITHTKINLSENWHNITINKSERIAVRGKGWIDGDIFEGESLAKVISQKLVLTPHRSDLKENIPETGHFALVIDNVDTVFAAVDRVRSIPLFYGSCDGQFYLSDDARWVKAKMNEFKPDPLAIAEFRYAGFVTGPDTLFPNVKQLQAGEYLVVRTLVNKQHTKCHRYYTYISNDFFEGTTSELISDFDKVLLCAFERLVKAANKRTLVIPLSAGLDSRLVIAMVKRLDYKNVIAFSYGKPGNQESEKSRHIAETVGYQWLFVPYSRNLWKQWYHSNTFKEYLNYADGLSTVPHVQDWIAVRELKTKQLIPEDAIFVPGHTGDFIAGGHIPPYYLDNENINREELIRSIKSKHYRLWNLKKAPKKTDTIITNRVESLLKEFSVKDNKSAASILEYFDWQERQTKHVVNSLRIYEFWDYDWYMPLWDTEVMEFWRRMPLKYKVNKLLYKLYLYHMNFSGVFSSVLKDPGKLQKLGLKEYHIVKEISAIYHRFRQKKLIPYRKRFLDYFLDQYQWHGIYPYFKIAFGHGFHQNIYSFLTDSYLSKLEETTRMTHQA
jgi:asparagine synthase (glutamine-hydrolysing)